MRFRLLLVVAGCLVCADGFRVLSRSRLVSSNRRGVVVVSAVPQVFVRKVAPGADAESLRTAMEEEFGRVAGVWLPRRDNDADHQGYGTVTFDDSASMRMALEAGTLRVMGKHLQISESNRNSADPSTNSATGRVALLQQLRSSRRREEIESLVERLGEFTSVKEASMAVSAWGRAHDWRRALETMREMRERGLEPNVITYSAAISACEKGAQWERALELLNEIRERGLEPNAITYSTAISACTKASQWKHALELLSEMREHGLEPTAFTYNMAISACAKASQWKRALKLLSEMREHGLEPDTITYNTAMSACTRCSEWKRALELLSEMRERGLEPNVISYNAAISACEKGAQWERALELLSEMRERRLEPNVISYSAAISACEKGVQWECALELLSEMRERGLEPNVITYNAVVEACCHSAGAETEARRVYRASLESGVRSHRKGSNVDLTDVSVAVAKTAVAVVLEDVRSGQYAQLSKGRDLVIITGRGKNSAVLDMLAQPEYAEFDAAIDPDNEGRVRVSAAGSDGSSSDEGLSDELAAPENDYDDDAPGAAPIKTPYGWAANLS